MEQNVRRFESKGKPGQVKADSDVQGSECLSEPFVSKQETGLHERKALFQELSLGRLWKASERKLARLQVDGISHL